MGEKTQTTDANTEISFLIMLTMGTYSFPVFVRAKSIGEAHDKARAKFSPIRDAAHYSVATHVLDDSMLKDVAPSVDLKALARFYWAMGSRDVGADINVEAFEEVWRDHGLDVDDE